MACSHQTVKNTPAKSCIEPGCYERFSCSACMGEHRAKAHGWTPRAHPLSTIVQRAIAAEVRAVEDTRIWPRVDRQGPDDCWPWTGATTPKGYGVLYLGSGRAARFQVRAHTAVYALLVGEPPAGLVPDHLCRRPACVNPRHLEWVTSGENVLRGDGVTAQNATKSECVHGHPFTEANTYWHRRNGNAVRGCRACRSASDKKRRRG